MNPSIDDAIKYYKGMIFPQDMSAHTLRAVAMNQLAIKALQEQAERAENNPLTLDELRQMDGEPVWVKDGIGEGWFLIGGFKGKSVYFYENTMRVGEPISGCGKTWFAYRHKPDNGRK